MPGLGTSTISRSGSAPFRHSSTSVTLTYKKTAHEAKQDLPDVKAARDAWFESQPDLDPERLVFLDETWTPINMARRPGWSPRGERLRSSVPRGHWKTTTLVRACACPGSPRRSCSTNRSITTPSRLTSSVRSCLNSPPVTSSQHARDAKECRH